MRGTKNKEACECGTGGGCCGGMIGGETGGVDGHLELPPPQQILILLGQKIVLRFPEAGKKKLQNSQLDLTFI